MPLKITRELQWQGAIDEWHEGNPTALERLLMQTPLPEIARAFLIDQVSRKARRKSGRPKQYGDGWKLIVKLAFQQRLQSHQSVTRKGAHETPSEAAINEIAALSGVPYDTISAIVHTRRKNQGKK